VEILFWILIATVTWCYAGYPLFIATLARLRPRALRPSPIADFPLRVTVVVAVRNEKASLARRIDNLLQQQYPADRLDVLVVSNGSQDGTEEIAQMLARRNERVHVLVSPAERGKAGAINMAAAEATGDVIVFADARQTFALDTVGRLVEPFADPQVGAVSGRMLVRRADLASVEGVRLYWGFETRLREAESRSGSVVGATGAIYGVRRALLPTIPANLILDDVYVPLRIAMSGHRVVMATDAIAFDEPSNDQKAEYARKRRTMVGNIQLIRAVPELLLPFHNPLFFRFVSHKLLRLLTPFCFVALLGVSAVLPGVFYGAFFLAELALYILGAVGLFVRVPALAIPSAFVLVHAAIFAAVWRWRDDASRVWAQPARPASLNA
jgi:cellulose synthase/poly-beta-1,6-N-acetylglucosamine synthase-like glycosyltransferase